MISQLVDAIVADLRQSGLEVKEFDYKDLITEDTLARARPSVSVVVGESSIAKVTLNSYKYKIIVSLLVTINHPRQVASGERVKKQAVYELLEAIADEVQLKKFNLDLENPLIPLGFRNITPYALYKVGYQVYQIRFWTSFCVKMIPEADVDRGKLTAILAQYTFPPDSTTIYGADLIPLT